MSKKSKSKAQRNHASAGQTVINFYNNGTINIDARQNNSRAFKHENNGCTINTPDNATTVGEHGEVLMITEKAFVAATCQIVELIANRNNLK